jgi:hypothetical protein
MFSLFRLLFNLNYWRRLFGKATWTDVGMSLRRAHKDRRARKHLLAFSFLLLAPVLCIAYLWWLIGSGAIYFVPFLIPIYWLMQRGYKKQDKASLRITPGPPPLRRELSKEELAEVRSHLATLALVFAVFLDRAASEAFLKQNEVPEGREVVSRRVHLELLKTIGAWDRLAQVDRDAMIDADGKWEWPRIHHAAMVVEPLRLLRWILRVDFYLPLVGQQLEIESKMAHELVYAPDKVLKGDELATVTMLETGRDSARHFVMRCVAELISRGCEEAKTEEIKQWATKTASSLSGDQNADFLLGGKLVSEAPEDQVRWAMSLSRTRAEFLQWSIGVLEGSVVPSAEFAAVSDAPA